MHKDLTGLIFGRLTVVGKASRDKQKRVMYFCLCECGNTHIVRQASLQNGDIKSCGCLRRDTTCLMRSLKEGENGKHQTYKQYIAGALKRSLCFELTLDQFYTLSQKPCYYCGIYLSNTAKSKTANGKFKYNGVDRLNNKEGYTLDNSVTCCRQCNKAKGILTAEEFNNWINRVYLYRKEI